MNPERLSGRRAGQPKPVKRGHAAHRGGVLWTDEVRNCKLCGESYTPKKLSQKFCRPEHRLDYHTKVRQRGKEAMGDA